MVKDQASKEDLSRTLLALCECSANRTAQIIITY